MADSSHNPTGSGVSQAPRRDKFAALASRSAAVEASAPPTGSTSTPSVAASSVAPAAASSTPSVTATSAAPRRDKLSALASRAAASSSSSTGGRGDKLAALAGANKNSNNPTATTTGSTASTKKNAAEVERQAKIKQKLKQRHQVLKNLDRAEQLTCKLLEMAHRTTTALQDLSGSTSDNRRISDLSKSYRATLQELHPLLSSDTELLIHPYQNHSNESIHSMYAARVEMRLAQERTQVLKAFGELERDCLPSADKETSVEDEGGSANRKRAREEVIETS